MKSGRGKSVTLGNPATKGSQGSFANGVEEEAQEEVQADATIVPVGVE